MSKIQTKSITKPNLRSTIQSLFIAKPRYFPKLLRKENMQCGPRKTACAHNNTTVNNNLCLSNFRDLPVLDHLVSMVFSKVLTVDEIHNCINHKPSNQTSDYCCCNIPFNWKRLHSRQAKYSSSLATVCSFLQQQGYSEKHCFFVVISCNIAWLSSN